MWPLGMQAMLKRHGAFAVSVPLGAYGAASEMLSKISCQHAKNVWPSIFFLANVSLSQEAGDFIHNVSMDQRAGHSSGSSEEASVWVSFASWKFPPVCHPVSLVSQPCQGALAAHEECSQSPDRAQILGQERSAPCCTWAAMGVGIDHDFWDKSLQHSTSKHLSCANSRVDEAGGRDLTATAAYPIGLGLKVSWSNEWHWLYMH